MHTLASAVNKGTISDYTASVGMKAGDVEKLYKAGFCDALLVVKFSSSRMGDGRASVSVRDFRAFCELGGTLKDYLDGREFFASEIKSVTAKSL